MVRADEIKIYWNIDAEHIYLVRRSHPQHLKGKGTVTFLLVAMQQVLWLRAD